MNALYTALEVSNRQELAAFLLGQGINPAYSYMPGDEDSDARHALHLAIPFSRYLVVDKLLQDPTNAQLITPADQASAVSRDLEEPPCFTSDDDYFKKLAEEAKAATAGNTRTKQTAYWNKYDKLKAESLRGALRVFTLLLKKKLFDPHGQDQHGKPLLNHCAQRDHTGYLRILLENFGAAFNFDQLADLVTASQQGHQKMQSIRTRRKCHVRDSSLEYLAKQKFSVTGSHQGKLYYKLDADQAKPLSYFAKSEHRDDIVQVLDSLKPKKK